MCFSSGAVCSGVVSSDTDNSSSQKSVTNSSIILSWSSSDNCSNSSVVKEESSGVIGFDGSLSFNFSDLSAEVSTVDIVSGGISFEIGVFLPAEILALNVIPDGLSSEAGVFLSAELLENKDSTKASIIQLANIVIIFFI